MLCPINTRTGIPPDAQAIPALWCQQWYAVQRPTRGRLAKTSDQVTYGTARGIRSAIGLFYLWDWLLRYPGKVIPTAQKNILSRKTLPNECLEYNLMAEGMARRMGVHTVPPKPLRRCHIQWFLHTLELQFRRAQTPQKRADLVRSALIVLFLWLGWLRSMECFSLHVKDVVLTLPTDGAIYNLPAGVGVLGLKLLPNTKASQTRRADVYIAYTTSSGLSVGKWWQRFMSLGLHQKEEALIFQSNNGYSWNSEFFRTTFLYPWLLEMRAQGDPYLQPFDGTENNSIQDVFYSLGCFRRGARLDVDQRRTGSLRKATPREINEHGRWRTRRAPDMSTHYLEWGVEEKVNLTFFSQ